MVGGGGDQPQKFLQIKQDDKFFSRLLSRESSNTKAEASFRVLYYGGAAGSVPFVWESQPGTPRNPFFFSSLPPLTPPPSYSHRSSWYMQNKTTQRPGFSPPSSQELAPRKSIISRQQYHPLPVLPRVPLVRRLL
ncbi:hypothetical protein NMG60_11012045 [Bertholletia excelsa]